MQPLCLHYFYLTIYQGTERSISVLEKGEVTVVNFLTFMKLMPQISRGISFMKDPRSLGSMRYGKWRVAKGLSNKLEPLNGGTTEKGA